MTRRKEIIKLLKEGPLTISEIASFYDDEISPKTIAVDLKHIYKTIKGQPEWEMLKKRAQCLNCGFIFTSKNISKPSKCPECYSTYIAEPVYKIEKK